MKEIVVKFTDEDYDRCVKEGQTEYRLRMKKAIEDEEYVTWIYAW